MALWCQESSQSFKMIFFSVTLSLNKAGFFISNFNAESIFIQDSVIFVMTVDMVWFVYEWNMVLMKHILK